MILRDPFDVLTVVVAAFAVFFAGWYAHMEYLDWRRRRDQGALREAWLRGYEEDPRPVLLLDRPLRVTSRWRPYDWEVDD